MISPDRLREKFARALSDMYQSEAPRYRALVALVASVNSETLRARPDLRAALESSGECERLALVRHGAVRVGTAAELSTLRRLFAAMGMAPVGYYDLSAVGLPVHSTAFRPLSEEALRQAPFRVFTSLLRVDLIADETLRHEVEAILARRTILSPACETLLDRLDDAGGLADAQADDFVSAALETFRFHPRASVPMAVYRRLHAAHPLIADIVCFRGPHINHLTLSTLDIDAVQREMLAQGLEPKQTVEGPPARRNPILLRQTSFKAVAEPICFSAPDEDATALHCARFGEVEQRGAALTAKGRALYDRLLERALAAPGAQALPDSFREFPDDIDAMRREGLAFFRYAPTAKGLARAGGLAPAACVEDLLSCGALAAEPITYEDFLPVSAAGIFRSNLGDVAQAGDLARGGRAVFEEALGSEVLDATALYERDASASLAASLASLGASLSRSPPVR
ncbi:MAG: 2-oxoadipate dioxygenase/decarboxylase HglS [Methylocystis sp.]|uniref:2-oxoadipate dioxygenase/decarboxylase HglS n=1 Tax=Methylocystis sp. TaxID=1911079 RepID=UPI003DA27B6B